MLVKQANNIYMVKYDQYIVVAVLLNYCYINVSSSKQLKLFDLVKYYLPITRRTTWLRLKKGRCEYLRKHSMLADQPPTAGRHPFTFS